MAIITQINERILDIMMNTLRNTFFYWNVANNCIDIIAAHHGNNIHIDNTDPITKLLTVRDIVDEDIPNLEHARDKIIYGSKSPIEENTLTVMFRINNAEFTNPQSAPWYNLTFYLCKNDSGLITEVSALLREMTETEIMNKDILDSFSNDRNPRIFNSRIRRLLDSHPDDKFAFVQFDVKNFKFINEKYSDDFGNDVLNNIRDNLGYYSSSTFISSRLTADVFMFVTTYTDKQEIIDFIMKLDSDINHYKNVNFRICYGINFVRDKSLPTRSNGDYAAVARMEAKENAISKYKIYETSQFEKQRHKKVLEEDMRSALNNGEFTMYLQPKYDIATRQVHGAEALARWIKPDGSNIPPVKFIPLAEENGFVTEIDHYIWEQACKTLKYWKDNGFTPVPISINVSRVHLNNNSFIDILNNLVKEYDIPKSFLEIEITETIQSGNTVNSILSLKDNGFTLLMDDFGSGYSSLKMINTTPFDVLKIDRSFLADFMVSERGKKIISHTIEMSQDIGIDLIAEGVENEVQEEFLLSNGCRYAQGFLFSRPITVDEFNKRYLV